MKPTYRVGDWPAILLCSLFLLACKTSDDAVAAAKQMATTSGDLASYYSTLSQIAASDVALSELQTTLQGVPFDDADRKIFSDTASWTQHLAEVASALQNLSTAFSNLTGSTAPTDVSNAASTLATKLTALTPVQMPKASPISLPSAIGDVANGFLTMVKQHEERKIASPLDKTFALLSGIFSGQKDGYDSVDKTYLNLAGAVAKDCIDKNLVDNTSVLAPALLPFGLTARGPSASDALLRGAAKTRIDEAVKAQVAAHSKASAAMLQAITEMNTRVHQLAIGQPMQSRGAPVTLTTVENWINTASSYLSNSSSTTSSAGSATPAATTSKSTQK